MTLLDALIVIAGFFIFLALLSLVERITFDPVLHQEEYSPEESAAQVAKNDDPDGLIDVRSSGSLSPGVRDVRAEFALRYINKDMR